MIVSIWANPFSGALAVSFREGSLPKLFKYLVRRCERNPWKPNLMRCLEVQTPAHKVFGCLGLVSKGEIKNMVVFIEHLARLNESITWLLYNAKQEQYEQEIGGIPKWISQAPCFVSSSVSAMCAMIPWSNRAAPRSVPTKHCVATSCVFKYPFYPHTSPRVSSNQDDSTDSSGLAICIHNETKHPWADLELPNCQY